MVSLPPASQVPVRIGEVVLDKYVVERVIGSGSMGALVAVRHQRLGEVYAMKFLLPHLLLHEGGVERFQQEARATARLKSEHVVKVHDVGNLPSGALYMLMEYVDGTDLGTLLRRRHTLPPGEVVAHIVQACDAISEAHAAGVVHRDLKPANLLLTTRPNGTTCLKVLDFGIAKIQRSDPDASSLTRTSAVMGSPHYMSPEQFRSAKYVGSSTDIWSLGVILYELVSGHVPFRGANVGEVCTQVLMHAPPPLPSHVPAALRSVIMTCLEKRAERRYASAADLARALDEIARSDPKPVRPPLTMHDPPSISGPPVSAAQPSRLLAATQLDGVSPVSAAANSTQGPSIPRAPAVAPKRSAPWLVAAIVLAVVGAALAGALYVARITSSREASDASASQPSAARPSASLPLSAGVPPPTSEPTDPDAGVPPPPSAAPRSPRTPPPPTTPPPPRPTGHGIY